MTESVAEPYLRATDVIDWTDPAVLALARELGDGKTSLLRLAERAS